VLLLDEAHLLHQNTLDHLHIRLNYQWDSRALLSLILVGLPELEDRLKLRRNRALYSRLHVREHIDSLTPVDTHAYVQARLEAAGSTTQIFARDAVAMLHEATLGTMRDIDRLANHCLDEALRQRRRIIERDVLQTVLNQAKSSS
jgi:type II secretory pathway predicted ATPase ExeA